jgi:hypothetical protein
MAIAATANESTGAASKREGSNNIGSNLKPWLKNKKNGGIKMTRC